jgi:hypothetical protein
MVGDRASLNVLSLKDLSGTNALAYLSGMPVMKHKEVSFLTLTPEQQELLLERDDPAAEASAGRGPQVLPGGRKEGPERPKDPQIFGLNDQLIGSRTFQCCTVVCFGKNRAKHLSVTTLIFSHLVHCVPA